MQETFHYLLMSDHLMIQKALISSVKDTGLTDMMGRSKKKSPYSATVSRRL